MAHQWRFLQEVRPNHWVIQCRACPRRQMPNLGYAGGKGEFGSARECHEWWREHVLTDTHVRNTSPDEVRDRQIRRTHERELKSLSLDEWITHKFTERAACPICR